MSNLPYGRANREIDISGCNVEQARERIDKFWEPTPMPWMKQSSSLSHSDHEENVGYNLPRRRYSDLARFMNKPDSLSQLLITEKETYPRYQSLRRSQNQASLEESLKNLFLDGHEPLALSKFKVSQNLIRDKERKEKERKDAIEKSKHRRLSRIYPQQNFVQNLTPHWENKVFQAHSTKGDEVLTKSIGGTELRIKDLRTLLDHRAWLNDEIINTFIEWVVEAANRAANEEAAALGLNPGTVPKFICHNSFFYDSLSKKGPASQDRLMKRKGAPGLSLLKVDSVFVPICSGLHWTLGVVRPVAKTIEYFDSMGGNPSMFFSRMKGWLKHQLGEAYNPDEWRTPETECALQTNGYDCGVFACTNAFCVAVGLETSCYHESDMTRQRRNIAAVLLNRGFQGDFAWRTREDGLLY